MPKTHEVRISHTISAPQQQIWDMIIDHNGMPSWIDQVKTIEMIAPGKPTNELGAKRKIIFKSPLIQPIFEEVVMCNAPYEYHYVLYKGMPGLEKHFGKMTVEALSETESRLSWHIDFIFKPISLINLISGIFIPFFSKNIESNVLELKRQLEKG